MKARYFYVAMTALALSLGFTACSDDDEPGYPQPNPVETSELAFDKDTVKVGVHETATFTITQGAGDYRLITEDSTIASATLEGNVVTVTSQRKGITGLVISDAKGGYKRILVKSMYMNMVLDKNEVNVGMKLGHTDGIANVKVLEGNGSYQAVSADESIAKIQRIVGDSMVVIQGVANGTTTVTITDMMGLTQTVNVTVATTTVAYSDDEKQELLADNEVHWTWDERKTTGSWYQFTHGTADDGRTTVYYAYNTTWYHMTYAQVWFTGDLSVGEKSNGRIYYDSSWNGYDYTEGVKVEIIKNDGEKVWGIFSVIKDDYLHYGNFVIDL